MKNCIAGILATLLTMMFISCKKDNKTTNPVSAPLIAAETSTNTSTATITPINTETNSFTATQTSTPTFTETLTPTITLTSTSTHTMIPPGKIHFSTNRDGNYEIYRMDPDGTNQERVTNTVWDEETLFGFSPDGTKMVYGSSVPEQHTVVADTNGQNRRTISPQGGWLSYGRAAWFTNGNTIALTEQSATEINSRHLATINSDGTGHAVLFEEITISYSVFGANNTVGKILYMRSTGTANDCSLWTCNLDGTAQTNIDATPRYRSAGAISPNGTYVISEYKEEGFVQTNVYRYNLDGSSKTPLTSFAETGSNTTMTGMCFSPDSNKIVFGRSTGDSGWISQIWVMNVDGSGLTQITSGSINQSPVWK